jgi:hypothetical protein
MKAPESKMVILLIGTFNCLKTYLKQLVIVNLFFTTSPADAASGDCPQRSFLVYHDLREEKRLLIDRDIQEAL